VNIHYEPSTGSIDWQLDAYRINGVRPLSAENVPSSRDPAEDATVGSNSSRMQAKLSSSPELHVQLHQIDGAKRGA
jgi:hypothetical protein